ncbi:hypothetical protein Ancab_031280 [Ancistrocladus abbreviatus]
MGGRFSMGGAEIKVKITPAVGVGGSDIEGIVKDQGDGTYLVTYVVPKRGNYMVNVECSGKAIMGSPFPVFFSAGNSTGGLLGLAPTTSFPNLVNQNMPNMPNYSASVSGSFPGLLGMIPGLVSGASGGVMLPGVGASLGEVCREYLNGRCFKTDCKFNHPAHNLLMTAIAATTSMGTLSQVPMAPSAAAMAAAQAIMAAQALAQMQAQSQSSKDSAGASEKEGKTDVLKKTVQVSNLSPLLTAEQLKQLFSFCGTVVDCTITESKHFAYIEYSKPEEATAALVLNNIDVGGRPLNVEMAKSLPQKPAVLNSSLASSSLPMMMQQAVAMQTMQYQQALLMQQTMTAQQAANRAATVKSATELASARAAEISKKLKAEGLANDEETEKKSRSPSTSRARSKSRSRSPVGHRRRRRSRSNTPSHRSRERRSKSPMRARRRSRSHSPPARYSKNHRSRSPLRSHHRSSHDYDYEWRSVRDSRDGSEKTRRRDYHCRSSGLRRNKSRSSSPREKKSYRDDSFAQKRHHRQGSPLRSRSPGYHRGGKSSPGNGKNSNAKHSRRSRSASVDDKHRFGKGDKDKQVKAKRHDRRRSRSKSAEGKDHRGSRFSPQSSEESKLKHQKFSRSSSLDGKYQPNDKDGENKGDQSKHRERRRSRSADGRNHRSAVVREKDVKQSKGGRCSRSKSVEGENESDGEKHGTRHGRRKHHDRRRSRSISAEDKSHRGSRSSPSEVDKSKRKHGRSSGSKSPEGKHKSKDRDSASRVKKSIHHGKQDPETEDATKELMESEFIEPKSSRMGENGDVAGDGSKFIEPERKMCNSDGSEATSENPEKTLGIKFENRATDNCNHDAIGSSKMKEQGLGYQDCIKRSNDEDGIDGDDFTRDSADVADI